MRLLSRINLLCAIICIFSEMGHSQFVTQVEIIDEISSTKKDFDGNNQSISFNLVRTNNDSTNITNKFVSINVSKETKTEFIKSSGIAITSNLDFAIGASGAVKSKILSNSVILHKDDLSKMVKFLNSTLRMSAGKPSYSVGWAYNYQNIVFAVIYEKNHFPNWKYYIRIDDIQFDISYEDGKKLIEKLVEYESKLETL